MKHDCDNREDVGDLAMYQWVCEWVSEWVMVSNVWVCASHCHLQLRSGRLARNWASYNLYCGHYCRAMVVSCSNAVTERCCWWSRRRLWLCESLLMKPVPYHSTVCDWASLLMKPAPSVYGSHVAASVMTSMTYNFAIQHQSCRSSYFTVSSILLIVVCN